MKPKWICLIVLTLLLGEKASGQPSAPQTRPVWLPDTAFVHHTDGSVAGFYRYTYNEQGQRTEALYFAAEAEQWKESQKRTYTYDPQGNLLTDLLQEKADGQWKNLQRNSYAWNTQGLKTLAHHELWSDSLGRWTTPHCFHYTYTPWGEADTIFREDDDSSYVSRTFYCFDANRNRTIEQWQFWDTAWTDLFRATSTYDSLNHLIDYIEENWNHTHGGPPKLEWEYWLHYAYTYDSIGRLSELQTWTWSCGEEKWYNEKHFYYTYDSANRLSVKTYYAWSRGDKQWVKSERTSNDYDSKGRMLRQTFQTPYNGEWINNRLTDFTYDPDGRLLSQTTAQWKTDSQQWVNNARLTWEYDLWGNLEEEAYANWDSRKKAWEGLYRTRNTFNLEGNGDTSSHEMYDNRKGWRLHETNLHVPYHHSRDSIGGFHTSKVSVHYRLFEDSTQAVRSYRTEPQVFCHPNPTSDQLHLRTDGETLLHCQLWDVNGRILLEQRPLCTETTLSLRALPNGAYLLRCQTPKGTLIRMIYKQ
ncbi:MAG: T9SS type A sorting domain-containing protein [Bacteroidales bacterium]|nr:T9SS type A sorting domain-containing protein [Bacteroidales bacterium]